MIPLIDFGRGQVTFYDLNLRCDLPLEQQLSELKEDLLQVDYLGRYLIDVGWYPEFSADGCFRVMVIEGHDWAKPVGEATCKTLPDLVVLLEKNVLLIESLLQEFAE